MSHSTNKPMKDIFKKIGIKSKGSLNPKDFKRIVDHTISWLEIGIEINVTVIVANIDRGRGYFNEKKIILPVWLSEHDVAYQVYYAVHELVHCLLGYRHDEAFKKTEDVLLDLWGIEIVRNRVYPKKLFLDGKEIYNTPYNRRFTDSFEVTSTAAGEQRKSRGVNVDKK